MSQSAAVLKKYWGHTAFKPGQLATIEAILARKDVLASLPTGGGKSICYQAPALQLPGICLVISPLIALMRDQVENLRSKQITAFALYSGMSRKEVINTLQVASTSNCKFLYVSPERLESDLFQEYLPGLNVQLIAVDEAHCISQWGYDFRPPYLRIAQLREELPAVPILALTASATPMVQEDIIAKLQLHEPVLVKQSFARHNLSYSVFEVEMAIPKINRILNQVKGSSIIYCRTRKRTQEIATLLQAQGIEASFYHAGLDAATRQERQAAWKNDQTPVMVCTNAFGMGIDKPDVRTVIHVGIPDCLENYYQEAGRAGRDGNKSYAVLLFTPRDKQELLDSITDRFPSLASIREVYQAIANYLQLPVGSGEGQYFDFDWTAFIHRFKLPAPLVLQSLKILGQEGWVNYNEAVFIPPRIQFVAARLLIESLEQDDLELDKLSKTLLRTYSGIYDQPVSISEKQIAALLKSPVEEIQTQLQELQKRGVLSYHPQKEEPQLFFPVPRIRAEELVIDQANFNNRKKQYEERLRTMLQYTEHQQNCRSLLIANYFGDLSAKSCGTCDNCLAAKKKSLSGAGFEEIKTQLLALLKNGPLPCSTITELLINNDETEVLGVLDFLQAAEIIQLHKDGTVTLT
ncbi:MAG: RecQ family ATP-dependent DNA helicase [Bacteroidetes bacterium]|nr:RecQ family ATP-dependent DNA helicase [Bacteroidota bacterium]